MAKDSSGRRQRGSIRKRGNSLQVLVYAGLDPLTGQRMYLSESTTDEADAKRILNRFRAEVEAKENARTKATLAAAIDAWLHVHEVEANTREGYEAYARKHIKPALGDVPVARSRRSCSRTSTPSSVGVAPAVTVGPGWTTGPRGHTSAE